MAAPGSAAWFRDQAAALSGAAAPGVRWSGYIASGGDASGVPPSDPLWQHEFEGNAAVKDMEGGGAPRGHFDSAEEAEDYVNRNAALAASEAWVIEIQDDGSALLYIADDTGKRGRGKG